MAEQVDINKWCEICKEAFNGDKIANDFILFLDTCSKKQETQLVWITHDVAFQTRFKELNISNSNDSYSMDHATWLQLNETKRKVRSEWHQQRQMELRQHLKTTLNTLSDVVHQQDERVTRVKAYLKTTDLGSVPLLRGLVGFLRFQLAHPHTLVEWHMNEYTLTQKDEEAMDRDIVLLRQVLGFQLVYKDDHDDAVVIPIEGTTTSEEELTLVWSMNADVTDADIHEILRVLPKDQNTQGYQVSDIQRNHPPNGIFQWLYQFMMNCFSSIFK